VTVALADRLAPRALGRDFRFLWGSSTISNIGDGLLISAGPLLVTTITREPFAVALATLMQFLPWVILGIPGGALIDRVDRRRLSVLVNLARAIVLGVLAATILTGTASLPVVLASYFVLGTAEMLADNTGSALLASAVPKEHLGVANSRLTGTRILANDLAGPPLGAFLFAVGMAVPFGVDAICALAAAVLIARIAATPGPATAVRRHVRHEIADGIRWLWHHPPVRALALTIFLFNVTFWAPYSLYVLYATERLGVDELGYGVLITAGAIGGLVGSLAYPALERRFALATLMRVGLLLETVTHLILAVSTSVVVVGLTMTLFGIHAVIWGTTSTTVRQRAVPTAFMGRVTSVYMLLNVGGGALGSVLGGVIAQRYGIVAPLWFAFVGSAVLLIAIWRTLDDIAHAPLADETEVAA
jgi:predicted MFS family arabinose efflux permease